MERFTKFAKHILADEKGAEGLEKLLIIAAVVLPLLGILIFAKDYIAEWMSDEVGTIRDDGGYTNQGNPFE